jgi:hypothetical protein
VGATIIIIIIIIININIIIATVPFPPCAGLNQPIRIGPILKSHPLAAGHVILDKDSDWWNV